MRKIKKFIVIIEETDVSADQLEDVIYQGFQFYDELQWNAYSVKKVEEEN